MQQIQNDQDHYDHNQDMDPAACLREAGADPAAKKAEQP
jgi:hypothetical protein